MSSGKCYKVTSPKSMGQALESLTQKVQCGVVINFEKLGGVDSLPPPVLEGWYSIKSSHWFRHAPRSFLSCCVLYAEARAH